jgi:4'-phosphopantetheinyl transferase
MEGPDSSEAHLWTVRLDASDDTFVRSLAWLSEEERERAERFRFARHRRAFILGRAALRALLGSYLGMDPAAVQFVVGQFRRLRRLCLYQRL